MKRGDIVLVVASGDYGKRRPAVIIQSDIFNKTHESILVCIMTSDVQPAHLVRVTVTPSPANGLQKTSQIMADKIFAIPRKRISKPIGALDEDALFSLNRALAFFQGLG